MRRTIGGGKEQHGLNAFFSSNTSRVSVTHNVTSDQALSWHYRFGHPSTCVLERVVPSKLECSLS